MRKLIPPLILALSLISSPAVLAQQPLPTIKGFWLTADFPVMTVRVGEEARFNVTLVNYGLAPQRANLSVENAPAGWKVELRGGGRPVGAAFVDYNAKSNLELSIKLPDDAKPGHYSLMVKAKSQDRVEELLLSIEVRPQPESVLTAEPKLPTLRGSPRSTFNFQVTAKNDSADNMLVTLSAKAPRGFQVTFKENYGTQELTSIPIKGGESKDLAVDVKPPQSTAAGQYPVEVELASERAKAHARLTLDVTGQPSVTLTGENDRLSGEASAGYEERFNFLLRNTGSAEAHNIALDSSAPSGWKVEFEPKEIAVLAPKAERKVVAVMTPSDKALAGDYVVSVRANGDGVSESVSFRVTVETSTIWGVVGLGVIAASMLVLVGAVGKFGRR